MRHDEAEIEAADRRLERPGGSQFLELSVEVLILHPQLFQMGRLILNLPANLFVAVAVPHIPDTRRTEKAEDQDRGDQRPQPDRTP